MHNDRACRHACLQLRRPILGAGSRQRGADTVQGKEGGGCHPPGGLGQPEGSDGCLRADFRCGELTQKEIELPIGLSDVQVLSVVAIFIHFTLGEMGWKELAIFYLLKSEGKKMMRTWVKTMKEEIVTMQEELGAIRDLLVAREQRRLLVISVFKRQITH